MGLFAGEQHGLARGQAGPRATRLQSFGGVGFNHSEESAKKAIQYHYSEHGKRSGKGSAHNNGLNQELHDYDLQTLLFLLRTALFADK